MQAETIQNLVQLGGVIAILLLSRTAYGIFLTIQHQNHRRSRQPKEPRPEHGFMLYIKFRNPVSWKDWQSVINTLGLRLNANQHYEAPNYDGSVQFLFQNDAQNYTFHENEALRGLWVSFRLPQPVAAPVALENFLIMVKAISNRFGAQVRTPENRLFDEEISSLYRHEARNFFNRQQLWQRQ